MTEHDEIPEDVVMVAADSSTTIASKRSSIGSKLKAQREANGLSVQAVAKYLRISVQQVQDIENDSLQASALVTRGFIRNYARYLNVNIENDELIKPTETLTSHKVTQDILPQTHSHKKIIILLCVIVLFIIWAVYSNYLSHQTVTSNVSPLTSNLPLNTEPKQSATLPVTENSAESVSQKATPKQNQEKVYENTPKNRSLESASSVNNDPSSQQLENSSLKMGYELKASKPVSNSLNFLVTERTWVKVFNDKDVPIYEATLLGGSTETVQGVLPLRIVVGNAHATTLLLDGKRVELEPYTEDNVARLVLEK